MPTFRDKVEIPDVEAVKETDKGLLCRIDGTELWIPRNQIDDESEVYEEGGTGTLVVSRWIAEEKGLA